jgi:hypothetical protein
MNNKQNNTNNKFGRLLAVPSLCELYPGICLTTEEKARKNLSQGSRRDDGGRRNLFVVSEYSAVRPCPHQITIIYPPLPVSLKIIFTIILSRKRQFLFQA